MHNNTRIIYLYMLDKITKYQAPSKIVYAFIQPKKNSREKKCM